MNNEIGGTYHYDCLIMDYVTGDNLQYSIRKLSVASFRFFIVFYCSLILISSLVFNKYKGHSEHCYIVSPYGTL